MIRVVIGSRNKKKLKEMVDLLGDLSLDLTDLTPYPNAPEVEETADTFVGNAALKATQLALVLGAWIIGEDSGLCVPALGSAPGVYSARYAGTHGDDQANNDKLLREMAALTGAERAAYYISTAVLSDPTGKVVASVEGRCHGTIVTERRGTGGFGYDPLFLVPEHGKTFGELPLEVKQQMSHRAKAFAELRPVLERLARGESIT
ncbi:ntp phosphatase : Non-canonical purine NTP pyrophosphatase OS=Planctomyces limnophilus (strain ATCC 43296 / DSM 3776 / IFAM 1008 / 290) GN=Plim_2323 PE=3 SV=1: Ham1p_like [Gemmata massiliana]|uniref:dITP/XTP pyrophosphatase n=1 Tax=Gemmata massiliana TaxID=1210884 RepID=A0A6P2CTC8_9BACT|nr:RdgB/HAM1 family non-canonical purine NTP pyrophosphatase [Gemmata massiliana]VTR91385.1 ntp phosphatase : Non-canonical purine NTP pyrophosphatase OS=Planctomyces limnophilus (strain ATCC 43296 / DSM 3776 / IFAM 1008 / 290) GN=Plim_2323 PE=3 SV=1: Ham1p_like [Gemmata massiliana]